MKALEWIRASQAILFEASIVPALVGTSAALAAGASFRPEYLALILLSLIGIQAGANLFKGYYEGLDRTAPPSSAGSWLAFDSGAAIGLAKDPRKVRDVGAAFFALGVIAGLGLVAITANVILFLFGLTGAALAWSYSSPPLKLSYRGIGELSTFLAFGPIMTIGATVAFGGVGIESSFFASLMLGFLAAAISFARYFSNADEDRAKGKRTPVTILGVRRAWGIFFGLFSAPIPIGILWFVREGTGAVASGTSVAIVALISMAAPFLRRSPPREKFEFAIAATIVTHVLVGISMVLGFLYGL